MGNSRFRASRLPQQAHARLVRGSAGLAEIAAAARGCQILPAPPSAEPPRDHVVHGRLDGRLGAVLAEILVAHEHLAAAEPHRWARTANVVEHADHRWPRVELARALDGGATVRQQLSLALAEQHDRAPGAAHVERLVVLIEKQNRFVHRSARTASRGVPMLQGTARASGRSRSEDAAWTRTHPPSITICSGYAKTGDARYLSLHDVRRAWERAARRAGLPLAYSRGFRPKPRLTFGPPLAVGTEGLRECVVLSLREGVPPAEVGERLAGATADGLAVGDVRSVARRKFATAWASYDLEVANPPEDLAERVARLLAAATVVIRREDRKGRPSTPRDIRPGVLQLELGADEQLHAQLSLRDGSIVTPRDLASALGVEPRRVVRTEIETELPE